MKPENEISIASITLTSVRSDIFTAVVCTRIGNSWCEVGYKTL